MTPFNIKPDNNTYIGLLSFSLLILSVFIVLLSSCSNKSSYDSQLLLRAEERMEKTDPELIVSIREFIDSADISSPGKQTRDISTLQLIETEYFGEDNIGQMINVFEKVCQSSKATFLDSVSLGKAYLGINDIDKARDILE